jgi:hypothetical protein
MRVGVDAGCGCFFAISLFRAFEVERRPSRETARPDSARPHSILDIPPVSVGAVLRPLSSDDDLLDEMLDGRA